jgi:hypothetical protein
MNQARPGSVERTLARRGQRRSSAMTVERCDQRTTRGCLPDMQLPPDWNTPFGAAESGKEATTMGCKATTRRDAGRIGYGAASRAHKNKLSATEELGAAVTLGRGISPPGRDPDPTFMQDAPRRSSFLWPRAVAGAPLRADLAARCSWMSA